MKWAAKASLSLSVVAVSILAVGASASAGELGFSSGYFQPWSGSDDAGFLVNMSMLSSDSESHWRWGAELEYRKYDLELLGQNIWSRDALLNGVVHYRFWPDKITPYIGLGMGLGVNIIDKDSLKAAVLLHELLNLNKVGFLMGAIAILGVEFPIGSHFSVYMEGRGNIYARIEDDTAFSFRDTSGWDVRSGLKLRF